MDVPDPDPEVPATVQRRRFPAEYRPRIVKQADACKQPGDLGADGFTHRRGIVDGRRGPTPFRASLASSSQRSESSKPPESAHWSSIGTGQSWNQAGQHLANRIG